MTPDTTATSLQLTEDFRRYPIDDHGKLRMQAFAVGPLPAALPVNSTIGLFWLPQSRKRLLPNLSRITATGWGTGGTLNVGHAAYSKALMMDEREADDPDAFIAGLAVGAGVTAQPWSTVLTFDMFSPTEILVYATVLGAAAPIGAKLTGYLSYLYE